MTTLRRIGDDATQIVMRLLQDAMDAADPLAWERRALDFERYPCERNNLIALNCRRHARLLRDLYAEHGPYPISPEVRAVVEDVIGDGD